jgi:hypothetical protein
MKVIRIGNIVSWVIVLLGALSIDSMYQVTKNACGNSIESATPMFIVFILACIACFVTSVVCLLTAFDD